MNLSREYARSSMIVGHRGLRLEYPDNSREGILAATRVCDMVEIDVRRTRDGAAVLAHDPHLGEHSIIDTDWPVLAELDIGGGLHPALLTDVVAEADGAPFNLEIKNSPNDPDFDGTFAFALEVAQLASERDVITSFHWPTMDAVHQAFPDLATGLLVDVVGSLSEAIDWAGRTNHRVIAPHWSLLGEEPDAILADLGAAGLKVFVWTVNDEDSAVRVAAGGAAAIISDDPVRIRAALRGEESG